MQSSNELRWIDYLIILIYFIFVLGIGFVLKRFVKTSADFLLSGRSIPAWIAGLAFLSANLGAQEVIGMAASGAKYGIATSHFYWLGAIPAMVFVGIFSESTGLGWSWVSDSSSPSATGVQTSL
jgi:solute:Na+ symporter, SSS family